MTRTCQVTLYTGGSYILIQEEKDGRKLILKVGSRCLIGAESRYAVVELELCGLIWAVLKL